MQGDVLRERSCYLVVGQYAGKGVEFVVVARIGALHRNMGQIVRVIVVSGRAVGPENEIVGLRSHQTQVERRGITRYRRSLLLPVGLPVPVDLKQTAVDFRSVAEVRRRGACPRSLRDGNRNGLGGPSVGHEPLVLLTCGEGQCETRRQQE